MVSLTLNKSPTLNPAQQSHTSSFIASLKHTEEPSFYPLDSVQKSFVMCSRFQIWIHQSVTPSSILQESIGTVSWRLCNGFLASTRPVKPAARSLLFAVETETSLLRPLSNCAWTFCPVSFLSCKLLTQKHFYFLLWGKLRVPQISECPWMMKNTKVTGSLTLFAISLEERPQFLGVMMVCFSSIVNWLSHTISFGQNIFCSTILLNSADKVMVP